MYYHQYDEIMKCKEKAVLKFMAATGNNRAESLSKIAGLEALGLLKFEEVKPEVHKLCSAVKGDDITPGYNFGLEQWYDGECVIGFVLWRDGEIVWRSWKQVDFLS